MSLGTVPGGNLYDKYNSRNPVARLLMKGFLRDFDALVEMSGATRALEVGCGEGRLAARLAANGIEMIATEPDGSAIEKARSLAGEESVAVAFEKAAIEDLSPSRHSAPLIICCEVLEHIPRPEAAIEKLHSLAAPWLLASVPREPLWRALNMARGAYWSHCGNTPGHVNHWSKDGFVSFLGKRFKIVRVLSPLPWTVILAKRDGAST